MFDENHALLPVNGLQDFIQTNGHLPGIPSEEAVAGEGIELGEMIRKLLEKLKSRPSTCCSSSNNLIN